MAIDISDILSQLDHERRTLAVAGEVLDIQSHVTRARSADGSQHWISYSRLSEQNAEDVIAQQVEHYRRLGVQCEWKLYAHDTPADLMQRLERRGFVAGTCEAVMVFDISAGGSWIDETETRDVARIDRIEQIADFRRVAEEVFGKDYTFTSNELAQALKAGSVNHRGYVAYVDGRPVSIGRLYRHPRSAFGGLYGGGTLRAYRGRGLYRAVVAARARDARASGARYLIVDALPTSRPILERMGFVKASETWPCELRS